MVAEFQHGLVRADVVAAAGTLIALGLSLAALWSRLGVAVRRRVNESLAAAALSAALVCGAVFVPWSVDLSESRMNSFARADERALRQIRATLRIEAHLAPEDPRRVDLERRALSKLRRLMPQLQVEYVASSTTGLLEQTASHYGEIWYELDGQRAMSRTTTADGVLETIFSLAAVTPPAEAEEDVFRGHPLAVPPKGAAAIFYGIWPALVGAAVLIGRRPS
jgi:hypothetical protein